MYIDLRMKIRGMIKTKIRAIRLINLLILILGMTKKNSMISNLKIIPMNLNLKMDLVVLKI